MVGNQLKKLKLKPFPQPDPILLKYPVLLCHGLGALGNLLHKSPLHDVALLYRLHCITAFAPNIVPYARIEVRAEAWEEIIDSILDQTVAKKLHVIAHSMAGLDIRYLIHKNDRAGQIISLTTVASPHHGTCLPDLIMNAPQSIRETAIKITDWFGNNVYPKIPSDLLGALEELRPDYITGEFNPKYPNHEDVVYQSVTAAVGKGTDTAINNLLIPFNHFIYDQMGTNDGYIPETSGVWGKHIGHTRLSHLEQVNINLPAKRKSDWSDLWLGLPGKLLEIEKRIPSQ